MIDRQLIKSFYKEAESVRIQLMEKYPESLDVDHVLAGKCIEASDELARRLSDKGYDSEPIRVFCLYEDWDNCPEICYEEHWLVRVNNHNHGDNIYIDPTMNQFQWAFYEKIPEIFIGTEKPSFYLDEEPDEDFLEKVGWTDYYENGDNEPNFEYWEHLKNPQNIEILSIFNHDKGYAR